MRSGIGRTCGRERYVGTIHSKASKSVHAFTKYYTRGLDEEGQSTYHKVEFAERAILGLE